MLEGSPYIFLTLTIGVGFIRMSINIISCLLIYIFIDRNILFQIQVLITDIKCLQNIIIPFK